jgi:hypothetical protein
MSSTKTKRLHKLRNAAPLVAFYFEPQGNSLDEKVATAVLALSRFDAAPLVAFTVTKEIDYELQSRVLRSMTPRVGLKRADEFR